MTCGLCHIGREQYEYKPLHHDSHEIRLLRPTARHCSSWLPRQHLRFHVETIQFLKTDVTPAYYAISYAWGQNTLTSNIYLDNQVLKIPRGAAQALRGVLKGIRAAKLRALPIWIDAVCIDQNAADTDEKAQQVRIMGDIFAQAECVLIWLGPDDGSARSSLNICQKLEDECKTWTNGGLDLEANNGLPPGKRHALPYMSLPPPPSQQLQAFYSLLRLRWFNRLWVSISALSPSIFDEADRSVQVVQEVVLSQRAVMFCGKHYISWDSFALAIQWARHRTPLWAAECVITEDFQTLAKINMIIRLKLGHEEMTMETLLALAIRFQSKHPLDKVYGLLGMASVGCHFDSPIVPNYKKTSKEVYAHATWLAIKQELSLRLLTNITPCEGGKIFDVDDSWPSWVSRYDLEHDKSNAPTFSPGSNAHNDIEAIVGLNTSLPFVLQAHGVPLGLVETLRAAPAEITKTNMFEGHDAMYRHFSYLWDPALAQSKGTTWCTDFIKTVAAALVCGQYSRDPNNPYQDAESDPATITDFAAFMLEMKKCCARPDFPELQTLLEACQPEEGDAFLYTKTVKYFAQRFVHLELSTARFGMGYTACQKNDEVCILFGARQPFVMRKVGGHYRLLGPVYVAGVMKGEYVQRLEDQGMLEAEDRIYEIR